MDQAKASHKNGEQEPLSALLVKGDRQMWPLQEWGLNSRVFAPPKNRRIEDEDEHNDSTKNGRAKRTIKSLSHEYYVEDKPTATDAQYDKHIMN